MVEDGGLTGRSGWYQGHKDDTVVAAHRDELSRRALWADCDRRPLVHDEPQRPASWAHKTTLRQRIRAWLKRIESYYDGHP